MNNSDKGGNTRAVRSSQSKTARLIPRFCPVRTRLSVSIIVLLPGKRAQLERSVSMKFTAQLLAGLCFLFSLVTLALPGSAHGFRDLNPAGIADGPGIWVNIWHYPEGDLDSYASRLSAHGIRNLFIQTSRSNTDAIAHPEELGNVIEACHRYGIRVIAWSFAELIDPRADATKMIAAAQFESHNGERIDGIAPNLEKNLEKWRVETYSKELRAVLGVNYPMVAVVFSPLNRAPEVARTPWTLIAQYYDVIAPMAYWGGKRQTLDAYTYTTATIQKIRQLTGKANVEIHVIGDGMGTSPADIQQFLRGCKDAEATSASLYPNHRPTPEQLVAIARYPDYFPPNSRFRLAAFQELTRAGALRTPPGYDPAQLIPRGEFYTLAVHQLFHPMVRKGHRGPDGSAGAGPSADLSGEQAARVLANAGLLPEIPDGSDGGLSASIDSREALTLVAGLVELQSQHSGQQQQPARKHRGDRWLLPAARAEAVQPPERRSQPLNYLDAAQLVLQARAGLR